MACATDPQIRWSYGCPQHGRLDADPYRNRSHRVEMANCALLPLADRQDGLLTRSQALECGLSDRQYHRRRSQGPWQSVLPGVVATFTGALTGRLLRRAALLYTQTGTRGAASRCVDGLPVCWVERSVADASRRLDRLADVRALLAESVQRGLTTADRLAGELTAGERPGSHVLSVVSAEISVGVRSAPEAELRRIVLRTGLPEPGGNLDVVVDGVWIARGDAVWHGVGLVVEVDSRDWHLSPADWEHTMRRHNRLTAADYLVLHFPPQKRLSITKGRPTAPP